VKIKFIKPLKIALDGRTVKDYRVGDIVSDPHPDLASFSAFYETLDETAELELKKQQDVAELETQVLVAEANLASLKAQLLALRPVPQVEPIEVEEEEEIIEDEGTKDERTIKRRKR
jgi:hypothetical protein